MRTNQSAKQIVAMAVSRRQRERCTPAKQLTILSEQVNLDLLRMAEALLMAGDNVMDLRHWPPRLMEVTHQAAALHGREFVIDWLPVLAFSLGSLQLRRRLLDGYQLITSESE